MGYSLKLLDPEGLQFGTHFTQSGQRLVHRPCPGTAARLGSLQHSQRQPHTAVWDFFLSAGFPDVCLNLTSLNCHTKKRKGHPAHLSWAVVTRRAPGPVPPRAGCSHHTTPPRSHLSRMHLEVITRFLAAIQLQLCSLPPFLSFSSFPPPQPPSHPFLLASVLSFHEQRVSRLGTQPAHVDKRQRSWRETSSSMLSTGPAQESQRGHAPGCSQGSGEGVGDVA